MVYGLKALKACSHFCAATGIGIYIFFFFLIPYSVLERSKYKGQKGLRTTDKLVDL